MRKYRIHWRDLTNGKTGHGKTMTVREGEGEVMLWVKALNKQHKGQIHHWYEVITTTK